MMKGKIHTKFIQEGGRPAERKVIAVCDGELLGKVYEEGERILDLVKYRSFYDGERVTIEKLGEMLKNATNINLVGENTIVAASKFIKIDKANVRKIKGVPHLLVYYV